MFDTFSTKAGNASETRESRPIGERLPTSKPVNQEHTSGVRFEQFDTYKELLFSPWWLPGNDR